MILQDIQISNFRSIKNLKIDINPINKGFTYSLIGINESGKSSILKAISLIDDSVALQSTDYFDTEKSVKIVLRYKITPAERVELSKYLRENHGFSGILPVLQLVTIEIEFVPNSEAEIKEFPHFLRTEFQNHVVVNGKILPKKEFLKQIDEEDVINDEETGDDQEKEVEPEEEEEKGEEEEEDSDKEEENEPEKIVELNFKDFFAKYLDDYFWKLSHKVVLWKSSPEYLISDEIDLTRFAENPENVSIPLKNCFYLSDLTNIKTEILKLTNSVAIKNLEDQLNYHVTKHINKIWPEIII
jgi:predicted ATP-dependent endonuclease of OLD family